MRYAIPQLAQTGRAVVTTPDIGDYHTGQQIKVGKHLATVTHIARWQLGGDWELTLEIAKKGKRKCKSKSQPLTNIKGYAAKHPA